MDRENSASSSIAATVPTELPQLLEKSPRKHPQNLQHSNPLGKLLEFPELINKP